MEQAKAMLTGVEFMDDPYVVADQADALVIVTEWNEFRALDLSRLASILRQPVLVDLRNIYPAEDVERANLRYTGIGIGL
jgi:UDPglucose 6-dehydrogenase